MPQISQLPAAGSLTSAELIPLSQNGIASQASIATILAAISVTSPAVDLSAQLVKPASASSFYTLANLLGGVSPIALAQGTTAYTVSGTDNSTAVATTAFVQQALVGASNPVPNSSVALYFPRVNVSGTAYELQSPSEVLSDVGGLGNTTVSSLPTSLPATAGVLWNNGGMVSVS